MTVEELLESQDYVVVKKDDLYQLINNLKEEIDRLEKQVGGIK